MPQTHSHFNKDLGKHGDRYISEVREWKSTTFLPRGATISSSFGTTFLKPNNSEKLGSPDFTAAGQEERPLTFLDSAPLQRVNLTQ